MSQGIERIRDLKPSSNLEELTRGIAEVSIRRQISSLYFGIINYWGAILLYKRGLDAGSLYKKWIPRPLIDSREIDKLKLHPDNYRFLHLESELRVALKYQLNPEIEELSRLRVACDHRLDNPAKISINTTMGISTPDLLEINETKLERAKADFRKIIEAINRLESTS
ncbi:MAG: hypothetical protein M0Z77_11170 [Thermoplasmatales archaeon]|nr:hypothetical protein [Thermoplasmatales archaeon]